MKLDSGKCWAWLRWLPTVALLACGEDAAPTAPGITGASAGAPSSATPIGSGAPATPGAAGTGAITTTPVASGGTSAAAPSAPTPMQAAGSAAPSGSAMPPVAAGDVTYHKDIRPLIEARCLSCHVEGGAGPFALDGWDKIEPKKALVVNAVKTRRMPPWLADSTNCTKTRHDQRLSDAQLALFTNWQAADFPLGAEADFKPLAEEPVPDIGEPTMLIKPRAPHQLNAGQEYYTCLQVDTQIREDTWVTAMDLIPQNPEYVHHAIVSLGGGNCDALGTTAENIYSYRPGSRTLMFEKGDALLMKAGQVIAIQFHYNTKFAKFGQALPSDQSTYRLWTLPKGEKPQREVVRMPHHDLLINIPVGAVNQKEGGTASVSSTYARPGAEIIGISPHMHYLGQTFKETLRTADGKSVCLVDIPDWDQDWQLDYFFEPKDYIPVTSGARLTQECVYSNRAEDQGMGPDGMRFTPQYTTFGEDTRQEMCLGYIWFRYPLNGAR